MRLYFIAGELSGDTHGADLIDALRDRLPDAEFTGMGGAKMRASSNGKITDWVEEAAVVGLWEVLRKYGYFKKQFDACLAAILAHPPDAVVLIDYPGFNLRLAKALKQRNPAQKIIYYISPQVWAWNRGRIPKMAKIIDRMLCIFPFEKALYEKSGLRTDFIGHPLMDQLRGASRKRETNLVGLFPGSRGREIRKHFPVLLRAAEMIFLARPDVRFEFAAASEKLAAIMQKGIHDSAWPELPVIVSVGNSRDLMQRATVGIVASGTASLEAACLQLSFLLIYRVHWLTWTVGKMLVRVPFLGMANLLAGREIVPEYLQSDATPEALSDGIIELLNNPQMRESQQQDLEKIAGMLGSGGAADRAAEAILSEITK